MLSVVTENTGSALQDHLAAGRDAESLIADRTPVEDGALHQRRLREWLAARTASPTLGAPLTLLAGGVVVTGVAVHRVTFDRLASSLDGVSPEDAEFFDATGHELDVIDAEPHQVDTVHLANVTAAGTSLPVLSLAISAVAGWSPVAQVSREGIWDSHHLQD